MKGSLDEWMKGSMDEWNSFSPGVTGVKDQESGLRFVWQNLNSDYGSKGN
jgi:hypothetical protein